MEISCNNYAWSVIAMCDVLPAAYQYTCICIAHVFAIAMFWHTEEK